MAWTAVRAGQSVKPSIQMVIEARLHSVINPANDHEVASCQLVDLKIWHEIR
jgi:hypothetical protein